MRKIFRTEKGGYKKVTQKCQKMVVKGKEIGTKTEHGRL